MPYVIAHINDDSFASEIAKGIDVPQAITRVTEASKNISVATIKNYFSKCGVTEQSSEDGDDIVDEKFNALFKKLDDSEYDMRPEEYVDFDVKTCNSLPAINGD